VSRKLALVVATTAALLISAGVAFAASKSKLHVKGPGATVTLNSSFDIKVSGKAAGKANELVAFEGGNSVTNKAISCKAKFSKELATYPTVELSQTFTVSGKFHETYGFTATNSGKRGFCAYLINSSTNKTYAHAGTHWTNG
jgi:hypothetical protein